MPRLSPTKQLKTKTNSLSFPKANLKDDCSQIDQSADSSSKISNGFSTQISAEIPETDMNPDKIFACEEKSEKKEMQEIISAAT
jgi:hypothetical protein